MDLRGKEVLVNFWKKHHDAEQPLKRWMDVVTGASWANFQECRRTFGSADQVRLPTGVVVVFNIKGNKYRLIASIAYVLNLVVVRRLMTHEEYSEDRWKGQL